MVKNNLQFFDSNGYNLNFDWNEENEYWEGNIYLPKVSVGLYANTTIYVLEEINGSSLASLTNSGIDVLEQIDYSLFSNTFVFPLATNVGDTISFKWDMQNKFVDEFFMFNFDENYTLKETSALIYTPNDGPDGNTLIINRFDEYSIPLDFNQTSKALPIHIAFMANEKYDATTYNRTLFMYYNGDVIARIKFYAETVEEDERLKVWNDNLGYNITPEDTMMFYKSDIKEYRPDYILLNEKRKELMLEGSNIYPYIGSYKAIVNAIKFFGYENLNIIEYWRCVNPDDENFGKIYHSSKYSLTHKETLTIGARNIVLPNKDYKKVNALALVYSINKPIDELETLDDQDESTAFDDLPKVKEKFTYTLEEALIKLFALRKKLNKEFMPGTSRIIDIIGEANYFGIQTITKVHDSIASMESRKDLNVKFEVYPSKYGHITDNIYFSRYLNLRYPNYLPGQSDTSFDNQMISDISGQIISDVQNQNIGESVMTILNALNQVKNNDKCKLYKKYYQEAFVDHTFYKEIGDNDDYSYDNDEYTYTEPKTRFSAKFILSNTSFEDITFGNCELSFKEYTGDKADLNHIRFNNIDTFARPDSIIWTVKMSENQFDEDLKITGVIKSYECHNGEDDVWTNKDDPQGISVSRYNQFFVELPYVGYYDVTVELGYSDGRGGMINETKKTKTFSKCIKVEPYNVELIGFYYDARELPKNIQYEENEQMTSFIQRSIENMCGWAISERTSDNTPVDASMPYFSATGELINPGPYYNDNVANEWYLSDNLTYGMSDLTPLIEYTRYIRSGVDVKPYTWFLLGYEYSKIAGKINPHWYIKNNSTNEVRDFDRKKYLTLLLKKEGNYTVTLQLEDKLGNKYEVSRNIIVVDKTANYKLYQTFKKDYDYKIEQDFLRELNDVYDFED